MLKPWLIPPEERQKHELSRVEGGQGENRTGDLTPGCVNRVARLSLLLQGRQIVAEVFDSLLHGALVMFVVGFEDGTPCGHFL